MKTNWNATLHLIPQQIHFLHTTFGLYPTQTSTFESPWNFFIFNVSMRGNMSGGIDLDAEYLYLRKYRHRFCGF